jgi:hypothetical protein
MPDMTQAVDFVQVGLWVERGPASTIERQLRFPTVQAAVTALTHPESSPLFDCHQGVDLDWFGFEVQIYFTDGTRTAPLDVLGRDNAVRLLNEFG